MRIEGGEGSNYLVVTTLDRLIDDLYFFINRQMVRYSMGDIDCFFQTLKPYSPLKDFKVPLDESTIIPFYEYISQIKNHMDNCLFRAQKSRSRLFAARTIGLNKLFRIYGSENDNGWEHVLLRCYAV